ncbi:mitochondrial fission ELM1 family protein [Haloferula rosea]|uniref:Mitochondrial fission ELM1 family protein n=1 Tax=Haloferula rosea TaxID=490093 RepID=A0A934VGD5_9BACT|nr:ELM1/GtrOC1 family putative glycosyltransferase [Haloferula rosea]MBK1827495.1 mitochondrial fission ELM1 family protein [Haloferula rosea]
MISPLRITVLSDGKPGHQNQSLGLAEAISRLITTEVETLPVKKRQWFVERPSRTPDLILGAGHSVHLPLWFLAKRTGAPSVVLMKPSLPLALFDLCVIPQHDLGRVKPSPKIIPTVGALNRVPPPGSHIRSGGLILLGGPSKHHGWDGVSVERCISSICRADPSTHWKITDSRRTPAGFLDHLKEQFPSLEAHPHQSTRPSWLPETLNESAQTWVSEDSVSMIYEALSSGTRVGLLPMPRSNPNHRVIQGVDRLIEDQRVTPFAAWTPGEALPEPASTLREADRVAEIILDHFNLQTSIQP